MARSLRCFSRPIQWLASTLFVRVTSYELPVNAGSHTESLSDPKALPHILVSSNEYKNKIKSRSSTHKIIVCVESPNKISNSNSNSCGGFIIRLNTPSKIHTHFIVPMWKILLVLAFHFYGMYFTFVIHL